MLPLNAPPGKLFREAPIVATHPFGLLTSIERLMVRESDPVPPRRFEKLPVPLIVTESFPSPALMV
jgi:hypothetical protein